MSDNFSMYRQIFKAYSERRLTLDVNDLRGLHRLIDEELQKIYAPDLEKQLKFWKLALKKKIQSIESEYGFALGRKRKNLPNIKLQDLIEKIAA